jgi:hypothetical protein
MFKSLPVCQTTEKFEYFPAHSPFLREYIFCENISKTYQTTVSKERWNLSISRCIFFIFFVTKDGNAEFTRMFRCLKFLQKTSLQFNLLHKQQT